MTEPDLEAVSRFPRGLFQPEGGFRFAADALLLAAFGLEHGVDGRLLDLGCGCGVVGLACLLGPGGPEVAVGLDIAPEQAEAANLNAGRLGLAERYRALSLDLRDIRREPGIAPESFDAVVANPPYRPEGRGRSSPSPERNRALFEVCGGLREFALAGSFALRNKGAMSVIHLAERLPFVLDCLTSAGLEPKRLRPVHSRADRQAGLILVRAVKNGGPGLVLDPPLVLYGPGPGLSAQVLDYCSYLGCNRRDSDSDVPASRPS